MARPFHHALQVVQARADAEYLDDPLDAAGQVQVALAQVPEIAGVQNVHLGAAAQVLAAGRVAEHDARAPVVDGALTGHGPRVGRRRPDRDGAAWYRGADGSEVA